MNVHVFTPCFQCMLFHVFTLCFSACKYQYICIVYDNRSTDVPLIVPCKYSCAYSSSCPHTIAHRIVVVYVNNCSTHMRVYFHHCLHACSYIHSMFSVHTITNISSSSTINRSTDVPLIVPMQVSMRILLIMCTNHCTL